MASEQQNQLFTAAIDEATMLLEKQGEFFPFAFGMKQDGSRGCKLNCVTAHY